MVAQVLRSCVGQHLVPGLSYWVGKADLSPRSISLSWLLAYMAGFEKMC